MNRVAKPLREMGAVIETGPEGRPPLTIRGGQRLTGMSYDMPMASAQVNLVAAGRPVCRWRDPRDRTGTDP